MKTTHDLPEGGMAEDSWLLPESEREEMISNICKKVLDRYCTIRHNNIENDPDDSPDEYSDQVKLYASEVLTLGLLYFEFCDAIREGDGTRIIRCYRYFLLMLKHSHKTNYSNEVLLMLYQIEFALTPRQVQQLMWSRTINYVSLPGHNVPCDLHLEHLNRLCKDLIKGLGANKTEKSITRIGKC